MKLKVDNKDTRPTSLTSVFIVKFELHISNFFLVFQLLPLSKLMLAG